MEENYDEASKQNDSSRMGIKHASIFNTLRNFHVIKALCVDVMRDILEGVAKYDLGFILNHYAYIANHFSLETLNQRVNAFGYDSNDKWSKPPSINESHLKQKKTITFLFRNVLLATKHNIDYRRPCT